MEKEFVPYKQGLELKELGFNDSCLDFYGSDNKLFLNHGDDEKVHIGNAVNAPLFSQAFRWFREKHNFEYQIIKSANGNYSAVIHLNTQEYLDKISTLSYACVDEIVDCYSYEEAELECLRKLIEIVKTK